MQTQTTMLLSISMAAAILGLHPDTVRDNPEKYGLTTLRTRGGHRRFDLDDVQAAAARLKGRRQKWLDAVSLADKLR